LSLVARRLDAPAPLVWSAWANSGGPSYRDDVIIPGTDNGFMVTGIDIPTSGCWEISAHYFPERGRVRTLSYTVWVEP
jgi:hypothetical protein